jgi:D-aminopeptidase
VKVYILTDLEGASYVVREEQTTPGSREYEEACLRVEEAMLLLGDIESVVVKEGLGRNLALCPLLAKSRKMIYEAAKRAKMGEFKPFKVKPPISIRVEYSHPNYADAWARVSGVERVDSRTIVARGEDLLETMKILGWY